MDWQAGCLPGHLFSKIADPRGILQNGNFFGTVQVLDGRFQMSNGLFL